MPKAKCQMPAGGTQKAVCERGKNRPILTPFETPISTLLRGAITPIIGGAILLAATSWLNFLRNSLYRFTWVSPNHLPGMSFSSAEARTPLYPSPKHPSGVRPNTTGRRQLRWPACCLTRKCYQSRRSDLKIARGISSKRFLVESAGVHATARQYAHSQGHRRKLPC
jgi:hypothetical protein